MHRRRFLHLSLIGGATLLAGCAETGRSTTMRGSSGVLEVARANGAGTFARAVSTAELEARLSGAGPYTVFAPSDAAFRALPPGRLDALLGPASRAERQALVGYHVVPGLVSTAFMDGFEVNHLTSTGGTLAVDGTASPIRVGAARVIRADLGARNGVVHLIDRVLVPR
jgi:uncharacterized surface protein with fasciclin (FAS1) repeats